MEVKPVEIYSEDSNYAVMKPPGRSFPGAVIQGDSLAILARIAVRAARRAKELAIEDEDLLGEIEDLTDALVGRVLHYQEVLESHAMGLPSKAMSEADFIRLLPESDNDLPTE